MRLCVKTSLILLCISSSCSDTNKGYTEGNSTGNQQSFRLELLQNEDVLVGSKTSKTWIKGLGLSLDFSLRIIFFHVQYLFPQSLTVKGPLCGSLRTENFQTKWLQLLSAVTVEFNTTYNDLVEHYFDPKCLFFVC